MNDELITEPIEVDAVKGAFLFLPHTILKELGGLDERFFSTTKKPICVIDGSPKEEKFIIIRVAS